MKKIVLLSMLLLLCACGKVFVAGDLSEKRKKLYEMGYEQDYCEKNPDRCVKGVQW